MPIPLAVRVKTRTREDRKLMAKDDRASLFFHLPGFSREVTEVLRTETVKEEANAFWEIRACAALRVLSFNRECDMVLVVNWRRIADAPVRAMAGAG